MVLMVSDNDSDSLEGGGGGGELSGRSWVGLGSVLDAAMANFNCQIDYIKNILGHRHECGISL